MQRLRWLRVGVEFSKRLRYALPVCGLIVLILSTVVYAAVLCWKLSGVMEDSEDVGAIFGEQGFKVTADGSMVVFLANKTYPAVSDLYAAPVKGGALVQLTALTEDQLILDFDVTPDGSKVIFIADLNNVEDIYQVFSVPIGGGTAPTQLNGALVENIDVVSFLIYPNSQGIIYAQANKNNDIKKLFARKFIDTEPISISGELNGINEIIARYAISDDSAWVVYTGYDGIDPELQMVSVNLPPNAAKEVISGGIDGITSYKITPGSQWVVFGTGSSLYCVPINASAAPRDLWNSAGDSLREYKITPSGGNVFFHVVTASDSKEYLYRNSTSEDNFLTILSDLPVDAIGAFEPSPDSTRIVFIADDNADSAYDVFAALANGNDKVKLNEDLVTEGNVSKFRISANSQYVAYLADEVVNDLIELFIAPISGGSRTKLSPEVPPANADVNDFLFMPDSLSVIYNSDHLTFGVNELFSVNITAQNTAHLNKTPISSGDVRYFKVTADSRRIVFVGDLDVDEKYELFAASVPVQFYLPLVTK